MQSFVRTALLLHFLCLFTDECTPTEQLDIGAVLTKTKIYSCEYLEDDWVSS